MSDGKPNQRERETIPQADALKGDNVRVVSIGITRAIDVALLESVSSNDNDVITTPDFSSLTAQVANIAGVACGPRVDPGEELY